MDAVFTVLIAVCAVVSIVCGLGSRFIAWRNRAKA